MGLPVPELGGVVDVVQAFFVVALLVLALCLMVLVLIRLARVEEAPSGVRCLNCAGPLFPLLDSSHDYRGEAACLRCGRLHEGVPWPRRRPDLRPPGRPRRAT